MSRHLPDGAAWRHLDARDGFESVFFGPGNRLDGHTAAVEDGRIWVVRYTIILDVRWMTTTARVWARSRDGEARLSVESGPGGRWHVDGAPRPDLDGCPDVDLESSACTNTIPVQRMGLAVGQRSPAPAVYVRAPDLRVERLEQHYTRVADDGQRQRYDYEAPAFDVACRLVYDRAGLVVSYPGIAERAG